MVYGFIFLVSIVSVIVLFLIRKVKSEKLREYLSTAIVLILVGCIMSVFACRSCAQAFDKFIKLASFFSILWIALWVGNALSADFLNEKISWTVYPVRRLLVGLAATILFTVVAVYIIVQFYRLALDYHIRDVSEMIYSSLVITFLISMFMHGRAFLINWKETALTAEKLKYESMTARYESLKSQVNPHFLFNSFNALTNLIYEDKDLAAKFVKQLSEVYRYVLDTRDRELVSKEEELKFLESYLFLQKIRFGDNLRISIELDQVTTDFPPLVLQMLIENAIKHNVISSDQPLTVRIFLSNNFIVVENTLQKKKVLAEESAGVGLSNIRLRYEFLTKQKVEVEESTEKFVVRIPIIVRTPT